MIQYVENMTTDSELQVKRMTQQEIDVHQWHKAQMGNKDVH